MKHFFKKLFPLIFTLLLIAVLPVSASAAAPGKVTGLKATTKDNTITLKWKKVSKAKGYYVYLVNRSTGAAKQVKKTSGTSCTLKKLTYNKAYSYKVCAFNSKKETGAFSEVVTKTPKLSRPATPRTFTYSSLGNCSINLKWSGIGNASGYVIDSYNSETKTYEIIKKITPNTTKKITISKLTAGKTYKFRVRSYRKSGSVISYSSPSKVLTIKAKALSQEAQTVRSCRYKATVKTTVTAKNKTTKKNFTLKAGTKITVTAKSGTTVNGYLSNGNAITVRRSALKYTGLDKAAKDYSKAVKEEYINSKHYSSPTKYFIWISQYTTRVNIFKGSQGKWKLVKTFPCVVGSWKNRTPSGLRRILKKQSSGDYGGPFIYFSLGETGTMENPDGARFHNLVDNRIGVAASHGCCRIRLDDLWYIYNNCPVNTPVLVY